MLTASKEKNVLSSQRAKNFRLLKKKLLRSPLNKALSSKFSEFNLGDFAFNKRKIKVIFRNYFNITGDTETRKNQIGFHHFFEKINEKKVYQLAPFNIFRKVGLSEA
jgi:hypothetical protein